MPRTSVEWATGVHGIHCGHVPGLAVALVYGVGNLHSAVRDLGQLLAAQPRSNGILLTRRNADEIVPRQFSAAALSGKHMVVQLVPPNEDPKEAAEKLIASFVERTAEGRANLIAFSDHLLQQKMAHKSKSRVRAGVTKGPSVRVG
jgi:hypothetical protein